jgi:hypothetical protein
VVIVKALRENSSELPWASARSATPEILSATEDQDPLRLAKNLRNAEDRERRAKRTSTLLKQELRETQAAHSSAMQRVREANAQLTGDQELLSQRFQSVYGQFLHFHNLHNTALADIRALKSSPSRKQYQLSLVQAREERQRSRIKELSGRIRVFQAREHRTAQRRDRVAKHGSQSKHERVLDSAKGGAYKLISLMGILLKNKDDKKGQQELYKIEKEVRTLVLLSDIV